MYTEYQRRSWGNKVVSKLYQQRPGSLSQPSLFLLRTKYASSRVTIQELKVNFLNSSYDFECMLKVERSNSFCSIHYLKWKRDAVLTELSQAMSSTVRCNSFGSCIRLIGRLILPEEGGEGEHLSKWHCPGLMGKISYVLEFFHEPNVVSFKQMS